MPKIIVAAVDGSEESLRAAHYAITMAKLTGAGVIALHVILLPQYIPEDVQKRLKEELTARGESAFGDVQKAADAAGVEIHRTVVDTTGSVVNAICESASKNSAGMIVVGTRGTGGVAKLMLGSVAAGVTRTASCPVLVVK